MYCYPEFKLWEKVYLRSQILERPSIDEYWNISGVPVLPENVIFTFFRTCRCYSEAFNTGTQKWSSIVQYSCTSIWDLKYTFSKLCYLKNLKLFLIRVKELFEPIVLRKKRRWVFALFKSIFLRNRSLSNITLGDFTVKDAKFGKEIFIQLKID